MMIRFVIPRCLQTAGSKTISAKLTSSITMSLYPRLVTAIHSLPASTLRPKPFPQLTEALQGFVDRAYSFPDAPTQATASGGSEEQAQRMLASLERLKSDAALQEFPPTETTLAPPHDPQFYTRLYDGVLKSHKGEGRSWVRKFFQLRGDE